MGCCCINTRGGLPRISRNGLLLGRHHCCCINTGRRSAQEQRSQVTSTVAPEDEVDICPGSVERGGALGVTTIIKTRRGELKIIENIDYEYTT